MLLVLVCTAAVSANLLLAQEKPVRENVPAPSPTAWATKEKAVARASTRSESAQADIDDWAEPNYSILGGAVLDLNEAVITIPRPTLTIQDLQRKAITTIETGENGEFEIELPSGVYQIGAELPGFYPFRRAPFQIKPGSNAMINVVPTLRYVVRGTSVSVPIDQAVPRPKYTSFTIPESPSPLLSMFIQYDKRQVRGHIVEYNNAVLSYDLLTVYASRLVFDSRRFLAEGFGKRVIVEDGKQRVRVRSARVTFERGEAIVKLDK